MMRDEVYGFPRWLFWSLLAMSGLLLAYTVSRAFLLSFTFDEAWSWAWYARIDTWEILTYKNPTANNHMLNSLLMKLSGGLFGDHVFAWRLPNVLAHAGYLYFSIRLLKRFRRPLLVLFGFLFLNLNPWLLDFFSLARGYGLAMCAMLGAVAFLLEYVDQPRMKKLVPALLLAAVSVLCNFTMLHFFLAFCGLVVLLQLQSALTDQNWKDFALTMLPVLGALLFIVLMITGPVRRLMDHEQLYYGGQQGFWADTVNSLCNSYLYKLDYWRHDMWLLQKVVMALLALMLLVFVLRWRKANWQLKTTPGLLVFALLVLPGISSTLQAAILGSNFLLSRTGLFFIPLLMVALVFLLNVDWQRPLQYTAAVLTVLLLFHSGRALNFTHTVEWKYDACTSEMLDDLHAHWAARGIDQPVSLGLSWQFWSGVDFYQQRVHSNWLDKVNNKGCLGGNEYYYVYRDGKGCKLGPEAIPFIEKRGLTLIKEYPLCQGKLAVRVK